MTHSVYWARHATVQELAEAALVADSKIEEIGEPRDDWERHEQALAREHRRIALDELVSRKAIKAYSFV